MQHSLTESYLDKITEDKNNLNAVNYKKAFFSILFFDLALVLVLIIFILDFAKVISLSELINRFDSQKPGQTVPLLADTQDFNQIKEERDLLKRRLPYYIYGGAEKLSESQGEYNSKTWEFKSPIFDTMTWTQQVFWSPNTDFIRLNSSHKDSIQNEHFVSYYFFNNQEPKQYRVDRLPEFISIECVYECREYHWINLDELISNQSSNDGRNENETFYVNPDGINFRIRKSFAPKTYSGYSADAFLTKEMTLSTKPVYLVISFVSQNYLKSNEKIEENELEQFKEFLDTISR